jgi:hypothetical protein
LHRAELGQIERSLDDRTMPVDLAGYEEFLAALKRGLNTVGEGAKADIIKKVVSKVEVHPDSATIYYRVSKGETLPPEVAPLGEPKATSQLTGAGKAKNEETPTFFKNRGSTTCLFGGLGPTTDEPLKINPKHQDTIMFFPTTKDRIFEICAPLYTQGMSLREIAKQIDLPRSTIKAALNAGGLPMRATTETKKNEPNGSRPMKAGAVPYGYAYLEGRPVKEPKEYKVVLQIQSLWQSGKGCSAIANTLNDQKIITRGGKRWAKGIISRIIKRYENEEVWCRVPSNDLL